MTVKRAIDLVCAAVLLIAFAPLLAIIALVVRANSPGPAIFRQKRLGRNGRIFRICKFRTMVQNAPDLRNADGSSCCPRQDPRVTGLGAFLRRTSLDELPQLWNVLRGDMSLVGPRPDQEDQLKWYTPEDQDKLKMRPGITGLAQISGRNRISWTARKRLDVAYVQEWSLWKDCRILCGTIPYVFLRRDISEESTCPR